MPKKSSAQNDKTDLGKALTLSALEQWLWDAACVIRGATDAPKFKDFILPLIFFKRLCDVFDDELREKIEDFGDEETAREIIEQDHAHVLKHGGNPIVRTYIPSDCSWNAIRNHPSDSTLGEFATGCLQTVSRLNPELHGVLDIKDYAERQAGQRTLDDDRLGRLIEVISRHRLGLSDTKPDVLGDAYEYLLRKFAEGQGQSAGEFYTPGEVGQLIAEILDVSPYAKIYDPACGSGGLLIRPRLQFLHNHPEKSGQAPQLYGQELNPVTYAMARMNIILHDIGGSHVAVGDTFRNPAFSPTGAGMRTFNYVVSNPMWNQDGYSADFYQNDSWKRFPNGSAPSQSADWAWVQHIWASLANGGRAAIVLDTGAVSRGSGSGGGNKERAIRKAFVEMDAIEGVVLLPENLFYNTSAPGIVLVLRKGKPADRQGQILLVNASAYFQKQRPKNQLTQDGVVAVADVFCKWESRDKLAKVISLEEAQAADFNLSPSQFVQINYAMTHRPIPEILHDIHKARMQRESADHSLSVLLGGLGLTYLQK